MNFKCPGQDSRNLKIKIIECQNCFEAVEFFSDEMKRKCPRCKTEVVCKKLPSCIDWCKYAQKCIGDDAYEKYINDKAEFRQAD